MNSQQKNSAATSFCKTDQRVAALFFLLAHKGEGFALGDCRSPIENPRRALSFDTLVSKVIQRYF